MSGDNYPEIPPDILPDQCKVGYEQIYNGLYGVAAGGLIAAVVHLNLADNYTAYTSDLGYTHGDIGRLELAINHEKNTLKSQDQLWLRDDRRHLKTLSHQRPFHPTTVFNIELFGGGILGGSLLGVGLMAAVKIASYRYRLNKYVKKAMKDFDLESIYLLSSGIDGDGSPGGGPVV